MQLNIVREGDNLKGLREIPSDTIDLIYCDPPFLTGRDFTEYEDNTFTGGLPETFEWLAYVTTPKQLAYYAFLIPRLQEMETVLKETGALYYHCDHRTSATIRLILNQIFGQPAFRNEIIWTYKTTAVYDNARHIFKNTFDNILFYAKAEHDFTPQYEPRSRKQTLAMYPYTDSDGRRYRHRNDGEASSLYDIREYSDEGKGIRMGTCWTDIGLAKPKERTGYPTQKPIELLRRIIKASSEKGDTVLDAFCGSGTALLAAKQLGRNYIGIDANSEAVYIATKRLA